jgi:hypothetical protein
VTGWAFESRGQCGSAVGTGAVTISREGYFDRLGQGSRVPSACTRSNPARTRSAPILTSHLALTPGTRLSPYEIVSPLGRAEWARFWRRNQSGPTGVAFLASKLRRTTPPLSRRAYRADSATVPSRIAVTRQILRQSPTSPGRSEWLGASVRGHRVHRLKQQLPQEETPCRRTA